MVASDILDKVKVRLRLTSTSDDAFLTQLIDQAILDAKVKRNYPPTYTPTMIDNDLERFESVVIDIAVYDYSKEGAEGESSHNENGTYRSFNTRQSVVRRIPPISQIV